MKPAWSWDYGRWSDWTDADLLKSKAVHDKWRANPLAYVEGFHDYAEAVRAEIVRRGIER